MTVLNAGNPVATKGFAKCQAGNRKAFLGPWMRRPGNKEGEARNMEQPHGKGPGLQAASFPMGMWCGEGPWWGRLPERDQEQPISRTKPMPFTCRSKLALNKMCVRLEGAETGRLPLRSIKKGL